MRPRWVAIYGVYGAVLVLYAVVIALEADASVATRFGEAAAFVLVPAVLFVMCALPLQRGWRSRVLLLVAAVLAAGVGWLLALVSWGFALPLTFGLWAVADVKRVLTLSGYAGRGWTFAVAVALIVAGVLLGFTAPVALAAALVGFVLIVWRITSPRRENRAILPPSRKH